MGRPAGHVSPVETPPRNMGMDQGAILQSRYAFAFSEKRRRSPAGVLVSVVLHVLIGVLLLWRITEDFQRVLDSGSAGGGPRGGGGGGNGMVFVSLPAPAAAAPKAVPVEPPKQTAAPVPDPVPVTPPPVIPPPVPEQQQVAVATPVAAASAGDSVTGRGPGEGGGEGGGKGGGSGPGTGTGRGPGEGTGGGEGGVGKAPRARFEMLPPPDPPKELRGKEFRITFSIDVDGRVRRVVFNPELPKGKYASTLRESAENYRFYPAIGADGNPAPGTFEYTMTVY